MKHKKLFAILTLVCFMFTLMPVAAMAETDVEAQITNASGAVTTSGSLQFVIENAQNGDTIKVLKNCALTKEVTVDKAITIKADSAVEINLTADALKGRDIITVKEGGALTLGKNLTINTVSTVVYVTKGSAVLDGVKIVNSSRYATVYAAGVNSNVEVKGNSSISNGVDAASTALSANNGATITVTNSAISSGEGYAGIYAGGNGSTVTLGENTTVTAVDNAVKAENEGKIVISGADVKSTGSNTEGKPYAAIVSLTGSTVEITSGNVTRGYVVDDSSKLTISGGTFSADPSDYVNSPTHAVIDNGNGTYDVKVIVPVESVTVTPATVEVTVNEEKQLTATVAPENATNKTVTWISSAPTVATVENGVVTAVAKGTATITATAGDKSATCTVTVNPITYTVTFNSNEGSAVKSQTVEKDAKATKPADPTRTNHTFAGWYSDETFETEYNFDAAVTKDITLYAKWTYNAPSYNGGGSYTPSTSDKTESSTTTTVTPSGDTVKVETETKADGTTVETTTTTTATGETTKVEVTTETNDEGTTVETTVTTDAQGETSTTVTATLDNGSAVTNNDAAVEVEVTKVEEKVVETVQEAVAADENVEVVGTADNAVSVSATNASTGAAQTSFVQPMAVSVPVDNTVLNNVEDTSKLTLAKVVTNEDGTTELVYMGGSYDKETGKFNAKVNEDGDYILVEKADLVKIELNIGEIDIKHNDKATAMEVAPRINEDNRTMLQLSYIADALGCQTFWDGATRTVTVVKGDITLTMVIDEVIPGFDTKAVVENGRTLVPAGYISGMLGANVIWDPVDQQVIIVK